MLDGDSNAIPAHHIKQEYCENRPKYRRPRRKKSVRVFTVASESKYLVVTDVPTTCLESDLVKLFASFGTLRQTRELRDYPQEEFIKTFLIEYQEIQRAKTAKRFLDEKYFYGGLLHVCYAPEYETVSDAREKIFHRRLSVTTRVKILQKESGRLKQPHKASKDFGLQTTGPSHSSSNISKSNAGTTIEPRMTNMISSATFSGHTKKPVNAGFFNRVSSAPQYSTFESTEPKETQRSSFVDNCTVATTSSRVKSSISKPKSKPQFRTRSGYFHQKLVDNLKGNPSQVVHTNFMEKDKPKSTFVMRPPPFLPRHLELKSIEETNKSVDLNPNLLGIKVAKYDSASTDSKAA